MTRKRMKKLQKWTALLLTAAMLLGGVQSGAFAAENAGETEAVDRIDSTDAESAGYAADLNDTDLSDEELIPAEGEWTGSEGGETPDSDVQDGEKQDGGDGDEVTASVIYDSHVQTYGWLQEVSDGTLSGTTGLAKRMEAVHIRVEADGITGGIEYRAHVQTYGWQDWVSDGALSGTSGQAKRLEAIRIRLTGDLAEVYDVYYRVHAQTFGWLGWAKNGLAAGSAGYSKRLEAYEVVLVKKGEEPPTSTEEAFKDKNGHNYTVIASEGGGCTEDLVETYYCEDCGQEKVETTTAPGHKYTREYLVRPTEETPGTVRYTCSACGDAYEEQVDYNAIMLTYEAYVQGQGWTGEKLDGESAGTSGQALRLEALKVNLEDSLGSSVSVKVHMQTYGWRSAVGSGEVAGNPGAGKRMEAVQISLTGPAAEDYDIYYRVHSQTYGWLGWAKNGESAGTSSLSKRVESIEITLVEKGGEAPGSTSRHFVNYRVYGSKTLSSWFGISRQKLIAYLQTHEHDNYYLGTPFPPKSVEAVYGQDYFNPKGDPRASGLARNPGTYMNCVGFVWHVLYKCGVSYSKIPRLADSGPYHAWRGSSSSTWPSLWSVQNLRRYSFCDKTELLASGVLEKGDIIWCTSPNDCHILIFWGDDPHEDLAWHSLASGNKICCIHGANRYSGTWNVLKWDSL